MRRTFHVLFFGVLLLVMEGCKYEKNKSQSSINTVHPALEMLPIPLGLGVNIHFYEGNKNDLALLHAAGIGIVRMDVSWSGIEKSPGIYDFSKHDKLIQELDKQEIRLLFIIDYGNPLYNNGLPPATREDLNAYAKFCSALTKRYADKNIIWELWNEPNLNHFWPPEPNVNDYMRFCKTMVQEIRKSNPDACIIAPATSGFDMKFMETCFKQGLLELVDGVSVHPYRNANLSPETTFDEYQLLTILIDQYKPNRKSIPILSGEWGYSTTHLSRDLQGRYLARQWLSNLATNVPISIWYDWHDDGQDPKEAEHNFGTLTWDYKEKPSFVAMKTLIKQFNGYHVIGRIGLGSIDDYLLMFQKKDSLKLAIWTTSFVHNISLEQDTQISQGVDYLGKTLSRLSNKKVDISNAPIYLTIEKPYPAWIKLIEEIYNLTNTEIESVVQSILKNDERNKLALEISEYLREENTMDKQAALYSLIILAKKVNTEDALSIYHLILEVSDDLQSNKSALFEITRISSKKSLEIVSKKKDNPGLMMEASLYYLNLAFKMFIAGENDQAEKLLMDALKLYPSLYSVERVLSVMKKNNKDMDPDISKKMARIAGFLNNWKVIGPFPNKNNYDQPTIFPTEMLVDFSQPVSLDSISIEWQNIELDGIFPILPFADLYGRKQLSAYAYAEINILEDMHGILKTGSNDGVVCWLNEEKVHENFIGRSLVIDEDIINVHFKKGKNKVLLKVLNRGNNWEACLRVCDSLGVPLNLNN